MTAPADLKEIIGRLEPLLGPSDGEPAPLDGGITNRNYRARLGGEDHVIRRPGKATALPEIDRDVERIAYEAAAQPRRCVPSTTTVPGCRRVSGFRSWARITPRSRLLATVPTLAVESSLQG
jgi:hypothetical protein